MGQKLGQGASHEQLDERQLLYALPGDDVEFPLMETSPKATLKRPHQTTPLSLIRYRARIIAQSIKSDIVEESARGTAFLFVPVWLGLGALVYFTAYFEPSGLALAVLIGFLFALRIAVKHHAKAQMVATIALIIAVGAGCAKLQTWRSSTPMLAGEIASDVTARIVSINKTAKSYRAILELASTANPTLKYAPKRVRVTIREGAEKLAAGESIKVRLRLMPPSGPVRPTSYDFAFQSYFDGIGASGFFVGPVTVLASEPETFADHGLALLEQLRQGIAKRIRAVISGTEAEVAVALLAGLQTGIDDPTMESLRITGLAHILSISGLHMALVAGLFMVVVRGGLALFPAQASRLPVKKYSAALALLASFFYLLLSGSDVAALRSFIMLAVFLVAILLDQQALTMRNLSIAAIAILVVTPHEIMGPSFQMSFAATAALISAYAYWTMIKGHQSKAQNASVIQNLWSKTWRFLGALAMTSIIAGAATSLFSAWQFHRLAPMGLPANLAAMPAVSLIVMPSAVLSALAMPFGLEEWPLRAMGFGIKIMLGVSNYFSDISSAGISGALNTTPFVMASCSLLLACILQTRLKWLALVPVPLVVFMLWHPTRPDILISEDAKLVAVRISEDRLAVNRERPNKFTLEAWKKALHADQISSPTMEEGIGHQQQFSCNDQLCKIKLNNGKQIAWLGYPRVNRPKLNELKSKRIDQVPTAPGQIPNQVANAPGQKPDEAPVASDQLQVQIPNPSEDQPAKFNDRAATEAIMSAKFNATIESLCGKVDILILEGPTPYSACNDSRTSIISARNLALNGSVEIYFINKYSMISQISDSIREQYPKGDAPANPSQLSFSQGPMGQDPSNSALSVQKPSSPMQSTDEKQIGSSQNLPFLRPSSQSPWFKIVYAIGNPNRPWNYERKFSRAARNLAPFQAIPNAGFPQ